MHYQTDALFDVAALAAFWIYFIFEFAKSERRRRNGRQDR